jgi:hypothetical protein
MKIFIPPLTPALLLSGERGLPPFWEERNEAGRTKIQRTTER